MGLTTDKFNMYIKLYNQANDAYYPDKFISIIHSAYIDDGFLQLPNPLYAVWDITDKCNLSCGFCSASAHHVEPVKMKNPQTLEIAKKIICTGVRYVSIRGGEPSLLLELAEITRMFLEHGMFVEIVSNGFGIDRDFFDVLGRFNRFRLRLKISLDCSIQKLNDSIRGKNSFKYAVAAMRSCAEHKVNFRIQMVVCKLNKQHIAKMYKFSNALGATSFGCILALPMGRGIHSPLLIEMDDEILEQLILIKTEEKETIVEKIGIGLRTIAMHFDDEKVTDNDVLDDDDFAEKIRLLKCNAGKTRIYISPLGDVFPCELMQMPDYHLGNILLDNVSAIWLNGILEVFNHIRRSDMDGCSECKHKRCNTGCYSLYANNTDESGRHIPNCRC